MPTNKYMINIIMPINKQYEGPQVEVQHESPRVHRCERSVWVMQISHRQVEVQHEAPRVHRCERSVWVMPISHRQVEVQHESPTG